MHVRTHYGGGDLQRTNGIIKSILLRAEHGWLDAQNRIFFFYACLHLNLLNCKRISREKKRKELDVVCCGPHNK